MTTKQAPAKFSTFDLIKIHMFMWVTQCWGQSQSRKAGMPFCASFALIADKLYPGNKEGQTELVQRHANFYMTDYVWGGCVHGVTLALEEKRANDIYESGSSEISADMINSVKNGLMGPLAGFGDTINQSVVRPAAIAYSQPMAAAGNPAGIFIAWLGNDIYRWVVTNLTFYYGYKGGTAFIENLTSSEIVAKVLTVASIFSMMIMGGLNAANVKFATTIEFSKMTLDQAIESMVPGLYQLLPPFLIMWLISKKNVSPVYIVIGILVFCCALAFLGVI